MPNINTTLRATVQDAKFVCSEKFDLAETALGTVDTDIVQIGRDMDRIFSQFDKPDFWTRQINFNADPLNEQIIVLGSQSGDDPQDLVQGIRKLLRLLDRLIDKANQETAPVDTSQVSDMNLKVLDALRITRQQIKTRLDMFAAAGQDLMQDPDFPAMQANQDALTATYRNKLLSNAINSVRTDVIIISRAGGILATAVSTDAFKTNFGRLTDFIRLKAGA